MNIKESNIIEDLWLKLGSKLKAFILSHVKNDEIAEDILQDVFIKIHSNIDKLNDETKIQSWVYQIARNLVADYFRNKQKEQKNFSILIESEVETEDENPENFMSETLEDMLKTIRDLPGEYCEALCLTELGGMSQKAYAEKIGISYSGAKSRVQRARQMLKDMLMNCCHYQFDKYGTVIGIFPAGCCCCTHQ